jgi:hypothetical protein
VGSTVTRDDIIHPEDHHRVNDSSMDTLEHQNQELSTDDDPVSIGPHERSPQHTPGPDHHTSSSLPSDDPSLARNSQFDGADFPDAPRLFVKSLLYGGDGGFFKEAFLCLRSKELVVSQDSGSAGKASHTLQPNSIDTRFGLAINTYQGSVTSPENMSVHEGDSQKDFISSEVIASLMDTTSFVDQDTTISQDTTGVMQVFLICRCAFYSFITESL